MESRGLRTRKSQGGSLLRSKPPFAWRQTSLGFLLEQDAFIAKAKPTIPM